MYVATHDDAFLAELLPTVLRFFRWLKAYRDPDDDALIAIIQPDESGLDASPKYDVLMGLGELPDEEIHPRLTASMSRLFARYASQRDDPGRLVGLDAFNWEDVMVNTICADGLECLG